LPNSGYDWLLVDTQHGPMGYDERLSAMLTGDRARRRQVDGPLRLLFRSSRHSTGAGHGPTDGILVPYINSAEEAREAVSCCRYPTEGTRSVYFPQRATNKEGLLGYVPNANKHVIVALQVETKACMTNMRRSRPSPASTILFLGQNDLCMSMGLFETYEFPKMYT